MVVFFFCLFFFFFCYFEQDQMSGKMLLFSTINFFVLFKIVYFFKSISAGSNSRVWDNQQALLCVSEHGREA